MDFQLTVEKLQQLARNIDQVYIDNPDGNVRLNCVYTLGNYSDQLYDLGAELPAAPDGYERCAECGVPVAHGGDGLCPLHTIVKHEQQPDWWH